MSESRALTNFIGTAVATIVVAKEQGELDEVRMRQVPTRRVPTSAAGLPVPAVAVSNAGV